MEASLFFNEASEPHPHLQRHHIRSAVGDRIGSDRMKVERTVAKVATEAVVSMVERNLEERLPDSQGSQNKELMLHTPRPAAYTVCGAKALPVSAVQKL